MGTRRRYGRDRGPRLNGPSRPAMLARGAGAGGDAGRVDVGRCGTTGRLGLLGVGGPGLAAPGRVGAAVCGFSTLGGRGFSVRGGCGMRPSRAASDRGAGGFEPGASSFEDFEMMLRGLLDHHHHQPSSFHHATPTDAPDRDRRQRHDEPVLPPLTLRHVFRPEVDRRRRRAVVRERRARGSRNTPATARRARAARPRRSITTRNGMYIAVACAVMLANP